MFGKDEFYFFSPRDRKYPNGFRPNRAAASGYWKATGTDKSILNSSGSKTIGVKKALVFYVGRPPTKTEWMMDEYRLPETLIRPSGLKKTMRVRVKQTNKVYLKRNLLESSSHLYSKAKRTNSVNNDVFNLFLNLINKQLYKFPHIVSLT